MGEGKISRVVCITLILFGASTALAQSGPALLIKPWPKEQFIESSTDALFFFDSKVRENGESYNLNTYESIGRIRLLPGNIASPRIGYDLTYMDIRSDDPRIPRHLSDQSVGAGFAFAKFDGWIAGATLGVGYAGDTPFADGGAWYGKATIVLGKEINENHTLGVALDYDGNRTFMPDVPLPGIEYSFKLPERSLQLVVGAPVNALIWDGMDKVKVEITYTMLSRLDARVSYELMHHISIFGRLETRETAFRLDELEEIHDRLMYYQRRVELGVFWTPYKFLNVVMAGGYSFNQEFGTGWDSRGNDTFARIDDTPYGRFGLELRF
jgi:hypothetical protein